jgi:hypothetical protein
MKKLLLSCFMAIFLLNSCIGLSMDIDIRQDGSGRITMEYRISGMAESIGRLDGNEMWPVIPVGRADWERTVQRTPGMRLVSFSSREERQDTVFNVRLEYDNLQTLAAFFDPSGSGRASVHRADSLQQIFISIIDPASSQIDPSLLSLARQVSAGYRFAVNFNIEDRQYANYEMKIRDGDGEDIQLPDGAITSLSGRKLSFSIDTSDILTYSNGIGITVNFIR